MLASTLQQLIDQDLTNVSEIAELAGVSNSTVYRWISRRSQPDFDAIRLIIRGLPNIEAQQALLSVMTTGTSWRMRSTKMSLDVNHDGKIDTEDALDAAIRVVRGAGQSLTHVRSACAAGTVQKEQLVNLVGELNDVIQHSTVVQELLIQLVEDRRRRRCAPTNNGPTRYTRKSSMR